MGLFTTDKPAPAKPGGEKKEFPKLPDGTHKARIKLVKVGATRNNKVRFSVLWVDQTERSAWQNIVVSPESEKAMAVFYRQMGAIGVPEDLINDDATTPQDIAETMTGHEAIVTVETDPQWGPQVRWVSEAV